MAVVSVSANNNRVEDAESSTGWSSIGGGAGGAAEGSFPYQGGNLYNRKITSLRGFYYDPTSDGGGAVDMTASANRCWVVKAIVTDYAGLNAASGLRIRIGSGTGDYYEYIISGTDSVVSAYDSYAARGGLFIVPIDPNVAAYRNATSGTPDIANVDYFGLEANFVTSTAKSENVGLDAIDLGTGLSLSGGDGGDTDGSYQDFVDSDEGNTSNRWGYASSLFGAVKSFFGTMTIGGASATEFTDNDSQVLWLDGLFAAGYSGVFADLQNASTVITDGSSHTGLGSSSTEDSRPDYVWSGTAGTGAATHTLVNFRNYTMTSAVVLSGIVECQLLTQASGEISGAKINTNSLAGVACLQDPSFGGSLLHDSEFVQSGLGHALEIDTAGTYDLSGIKFTGYGADASNSSAILVSETSDTVTINISGGGDTPTYTSAGATVVINNNKSVTLDGLPVSGIEVRIYNNIGTQQNPIAGADIAGVENETSGSFTFSSSAGTNVLIVIFDTVNSRDGGVYRGYTVPNNDVTLPFEFLTDRNYLNP